MNKQWKHKTHAVLHLIHTAATVVEYILFPNQQYFLVCLDC